jgi:hypothetical protein
VPGNVKMKKLAPKKTRRRTVNLNDIKINRLVPVPEEKIKFAANRDLLGSKSFILITTNDAGMINYGSWTSQLSPIELMGLVAFIYQMSSNPSIVIYPSDD